MRAAPVSVPAVSLPVGRAHHAGRTGPAAKGSFWEYFIGFAFAVVLVGIDLAYRYPQLAEFNRAMGIVVALGAFALVRSARAVVPRREVLLLIAFVAWIVLTGTIVADDIEQLWRYTRLTIQVLGLGLAVAVFAQTRLRIRLILLALVIAGVAAGVGWFTGAEGGVDMEPWREAGRAAGLFKNPNSLALRSQLAIVGTLGLIGQTRRFSVRAVLIALTIAFSGLILATASRKHFLVLLLFPVMAAWMMSKGRRFRLWQKALAVVAALALSAGLYFASRDLLVAKRFEESRESAEGRGQLYVIGWGLLLSNPVMGVGWGHYASASGEGMLSHSEFIEVAASAGLVGAGLYFAVPILTWRRLDRVRRGAGEAWARNTAGFLLASLGALLLVGLGAPLCYSPSAWFVFGLCMGHAWGMSRPLKLRGARSPSTARRPASLRKMIRSEKNDDSSPRDERWVGDGSREVPRGLQKLDLGR